MLVNNHGQQAVAQGWAVQERLADGLDGVKNVALAAVALGVLGGSAYLVYQYSSQLGIKRSLALTGIGGAGYVAVIWKTMDAKRSFQTMWNGRAEMRRRNEAEWQRTKTAAANWFRSLF